MFTGIVEEIANVSNISKSQKTFKLSIKAKKVLEGTKIGDSICTNGVCLTVCKIDNDLFTVDVMEETLNKSSLSQLKIGSKVNVERALSANGRLDGHIVTGHIDGVGTISKINHEENGVWVYIKSKKEILDGIVYKGSITVDGVSLTVAHIDEESFAVSLIPHTYKNTLFSLKSVGSLVNLECDVIGKYVYKFFSNKQSNNKSSIDKKFLLENGFM